MENESKPHAATKIGNINVAYDEDGNILGMDYGGGEGRKIEWYDNDMIKVVYNGYPTNYLTQFYWYDEGKRRIKKYTTSYRTRGGTMYPNEYMNINTKKKMDVADEDEIYSRTKHIYVNNQRIVSRIKIENSNTYTYFYGTDHLGSKTYLTDDMGNIVEHIEYMPWGEEWDESGYVMLGAEYKFTGKEKDETELYYYGARYYDPEISMWISTDPAMEKVILTLKRGRMANKGIYDSNFLGLYSYTKNNPLNYVDLEGEYPIWQKFWEALQKIEDPLLKGILGTLTPFVYGIHVVENIGELAIGTIINPWAPIDYTWGAGPTILGLGFGVLGIVTTGEAIIHWGRGVQVSGGILEQMISSGGMTIGPVMLINRQYAENIRTFYLPDDKKVKLPLIQHEYGHTIQSRILGPLYIFGGIWSLLDAATAKTPEEHFKMIFEKWATELGKGNW